MGATHYLVLNCDEVFIVDNQSWLSIHEYVIQNWVKIPIFISLDQVVEGLRNDNSTKVIMEALMILWLDFQFHNRQFLGFQIIVGVENWKYLNAMGIQFNFAIQHLTFEVNGYHM
jgi:hypothetical protein